ncbi:hypothetical protein QOZ98_001364 [Planomicrobium stackebrandtii]|uniref:Uncharacterized protein n=1 Tax=Planomicrobium stackebrandtii TaxID=253160 RepID=A0ABU0GT47_9BACL|nr:hypothetical protein [Planomicrobium stackebrandtii]MDQ0428538.1 hypothetical protein [Planomicrobium stackebrandtii]
MSVKTQDLTLKIKVVDQYTQEIVAVEKKPSIIISNEQLNSIDTILTIYKTLSSGNTIPSIEEISENILNNAYDSGYQKALTKAVTPEGTYPLFAIDNNLIETKDVHLALQRVEVFLRVYLNENKNILIEAILNTLNKRDFQFSYYYKGELFNSSIQSVW